MSKTLIIVESPIKAKEIRHVLDSSYIVEASYGHIFDLPKSEMGVNIEKDFEPKYGFISDKAEAQLRLLKNTASQCDLILLAADKDREGEAIAWHLKNALSGLKKPIKRIEFDEITKKGILAGVKKPRELKEDLFNAQQARRVLDRFVGYMISPFVIKNYGPNLSAGRTQSVAVKMIVDREKEIQNFKPEEYWTITANLVKQGEKESFYTKYVEKVTDKDTAEKIKKELEAGTFVVSSIDQNKKEKKPNPPFITSKLVAATAGKFKWKADKTMKLAQSLFDGGYITYHRTDSVRSSEDRIEDCRNWLKDNSFEIPKKSNHYANKDAAQDAHEAIHPTDVSRKDSDLLISDDEKKLYKLIWERFVASQMNSAIYETATVIVETSDKHKLKANGRILRSKGWLALLPDEEEDSDVKLPALNVKDILELVKPGIKAEQKFTKPPPRFTGKTLIEELESYGIGRPATYAALTAKVQDRFYVTEDKGVFYPTELGVKVTEDLASHFDFLKYDYTAETEEKLDLIAAGKLSYLKMMKEFYPLLVEQLKNAYFSKKKDYGFRCPKCEGFLDLRDGQFGPYLSCYDYPNCKYTQSVDIVDGKPTPRESKIKTVDGIKCQRCGSGMFKKDGKFGPFYGCSAYPKCTAIQNIPVGKKCVKCGKDMCARVFNKEIKLSCMTYPNCSNIESLPKGMKIDWHDPSEINKTKPNKKELKNMKEI